MPEKSFFKTFLIFSFLFFISLFTSCKVEWFGGLEDDLDEKLTNTVYFYIENPDTSFLNPNIPIEKKYMIGTRLTQEDFPQNGSAELYALRPGYTITPEWKSTSTELGTDFLYTVTDNVVSYLTVPPKEKGVAKLYLSTADWHPNTNTPFTVHYELQNIYDDEYTPWDSPESGVTDQSYMILSLDSYKALKGTSGAGAFSAADSETDTITVKGDGSASKVVYMNRNKRTLNFTLDTSNSESWDEWPVIYTDTIITKEKEENKYSITCRHGYEYKVLKDDIEVLKPEKSGYSFYGWTNEETASKVCSDYENPYDYILSFDESASKKFPVEITADSNYYPVWGPIFYKVYLEGPGGTEFNGSLGSDITIYDDEPGKKYIKISSATALPEPVLPSGYNSADYEFDTYYFNPDSGVLDFEYLYNGTNYICGGGDTISEGTLTAKWIYKNIYLDPVGGNDNNDGLSAGTAVQSVSKAKELAKDEMTNTSGNSIYLMNKITDPIELTTLNTITISDYHNVIIKRAEGVKGTLIEIPSGTSLPWRSITFDGNKDKVTATSPFIVNNGTLALKEQIEFKNITSSSTNDYGGVIKNIGTLELGSASYTNDVLFNTIVTQKGGAIYNASGTVKLYGNVKFTSCSGNTSAGLPGKANALYIKAGTLEINSFAQQTSGITDLSISLNEGAVIKVTGDYGSGTTDIFNLYLGDESSTGTLNDFDSSGYTLLTADSGTSYIQNVYNKINLPDSTYNASTSTAGWKIDENGKLVYATFGGGGIRIPTNFIAKFGVIFNGTSNGALYASNPSSPVITLSSPDFEIGITIKLWYDSETDENLVIFASNKVIQDITDPDFQNYTAKIYYSSVETPATLNFSGKLTGSADWPPGEYTVYIYFEYMGVPYSIYIPFTVDY